MSSPQDEADGKKRKQRKKLLYQKILQQMEFYYSPANLSKDRWLAQKLNDQGKVELAAFLEFQKIKCLTDNVNDLAKALKKSELLTVTEDMKVVLNKTVVMKENEDDCVIYIEQIPPDADHDWVKSIFSVYGDIDYVSLPKFKNSNKRKGFGFVEFGTPEMAQRAIEDFKEKGNYLSTDIAPGELLSIASYEGDKKVDSSKNESDEVMDTSEKSSNEISRKRKNSEMQEEQDGKKLKVDQESENVSDTQDTSATEDNADTEGTKKKKNRKKKTKKKKNKEPVPNAGLQILSKRDWKRLRNKYLNMQKEKMKQLKKHLVLAQKSNKYNKNNTSENSKEEVSKENTKPSKIEIENIKFEPGVIVAIEFDEPVVDVKGTKKQLRENPSVKYIDVKEGQRKVHLRFGSASEASQFCNESTFPKSSVLKGDQETSYWHKIQEQRKKLYTTSKNKKMRGKDKLMKKAEHILGKHLTFDDAF